MAAPHPPTMLEEGLSPVEILASASVLVVLLLWCARLEPSHLHRLFGNRPPYFAIAVCLGASFAGYLSFLIPTHISASTRIAGSLLAATVSVALLFLLLFLDQNPAVSFVLLVIAPANAVRSRCGLNRSQALAGAFFAAIVLVAVAGLIRA